MNFKPTGAEAQWRTVYRNIHQLPVNAMVTMDYLRELLPNAAEGSIRTAFHRAMKEMEIVDQRSFVTEWGVGYRVASAKEHEGLAKRQQRFARRRVENGLRKAASADRSQLTSDEVRRLSALEDHLRRSQSFLKQLERRADQPDAVEKAAARAVSQVPKQALAVTEDGLNDLYSLLARYGIKRELTD